MSDERHPKDYEGLHAFAFIHPKGKKPEDVVRDLRALGKPPIMYASAFLGHYPVFAHVQAETLAQLQDLMDRILWEKGVNTSWSTESDYVGKGGAQPLGAKRRSLGLIALTQVKVQPGTARDVLATIGERGERDGFVGASVVSGDFDILLQMTGESIEDVEAKVEARLRGISAVVGTSTAFADGDRTEELYGPIPVRSEGS